MEFLPMFNVNESDDGKNLSFPEYLPLLALKNTVLFPGVIIPITVGRQKSVEAVQEAERTDKLIGVFTQKQINIQDPNFDDLNNIGVVAKIVKLIEMPDGTSTAILQGIKRVRLDELSQSIPYLKGRLIALSTPEIDLENKQLIALAASIKDIGTQIIELSPQIPQEATAVLKNIKNPSFLINFVGSNLNIELNAKQELLEIDDTIKKAEEVLKHMHNEVQILQIKGQIENKVKTDLEKQQRDYVLGQQLKTIQEELGESPQKQDIDELEDKAKAKIWSKATQDKFDKEFKKLRRMNPAVPEYSILLNYLELLVDLPWDEYTDDNFDLHQAGEILDRDHFGLDKVKDRIIEYLAVLKLRQDMKSPILCLVGPPGVGKTSLGKSIAAALGRKYIRMSLGGLHDEAELRGHRKTYIGAMPGRIVQSIKKAEASNPVFILDEIDKIGRGVKGDPSSALLEILDPEQNTTFYDNYLELEYDLSKILFIATANSLGSIQPALLDRMEIIEVSGYSVEEKLEIAKRHLIPKQLKEHGLEEKHASLSEETLYKLVQEYTRESGVRSLDRVVARVMRSVAKKVAMDETYSPDITPEDLTEILGPKRVSLDAYEKDQGPGVAVGLAWTQVGGDILFIEASKSKGKGKLTLTGNLGDVMKESATTALSFLRAHCEKFGVESSAFDESNIHIHVPAGAIPKDGPSAGITMLSALTSAFTGRPLRPYIAMTGEITLRGKVLPVGGIKEKVLAAKRAGIKEIILCKDNEKDIKEVNEDYLKGLEFHYVERMEEVVKLALQE
ncbi:MAG: endopeptidase La [Aureispira sp.]|nr:endopeptidase La [Aureispira sp.]